jgi:DNA (cytosine-5)-methyltransferase 1
MPGAWWASPTYYGTRSRNFEIDADFAFLLGAYVGDGWLGKGTRAHKIILGLNREKAEAVLSRLKGFKVHESKQRTGVRLEVALREGDTERIRRCFGEYAVNKKVPYWLLTADAKIKEAFVAGWDLTDGTRELTSGSRRTTTISRELAVTGRMLLTTMGFTVSLRKIATPRTTVIEGRTVNQQDYYTLNRSKNQRYVIQDVDHAWYKAKTWTPSEVEQRVYNIEVDEDNSYVCDGIVVHNCQPFSSAGQGKGFEDDRHLWPDFYRLIDARKPNRIMGEQVASKDGLAWLDLVFDDLERTGHSVRAADTCSAGIGAPHIRQRLYWMADSNDAGLERYGRSEQEYDPQGRQVEDGYGSAVCVGSGLAYTDGRNSSAEREQRRREQRLFAESSSAIGLADTSSTRLEVGASETSGRGGSQLGPERLLSIDQLDNSGRPCPTNGFWRDADWLFCTDGKWRPVRPGSFPLVNGATSRMGKLRAYGNAINAHQAKAFIESVW